MPGEHAEVHAAFSHASMRSCSGDTVSRTVPAAEGCMEKRLGRLEAEIQNLQHASDTEATQRQGVLLFGPNGVLAHMRDPEQRHQAFDILAHSGCRT